MGAWEDGFAAGYERGLLQGSMGRKPTIAEASRGRRIRKRSAGSAKAKPRKLTAHNRFMKKEMRTLRRKHPRMKQTQIMKKANVAWRKKKRGKRCPNHTI